MENPNAQCEEKCRIGRVKPRNHCMVAVADWSICIMWYHSDNKGFVFVVSREKKKN